MATTAPLAVLAPNPSPLTLDGTRTYVVGRQRTAVIDPGPDLDSHIDAVARAVGNALQVHVLLTHDHPDHAAGASALADRFGAVVRAAGEGTLAAGDRIDTDAGELIALASPGHTRDHIAFHWPAASAIFCGDLLLGGQDTALVASPEGDLAEYLESLERLRRLEPRTVYPAHGPPFQDPAATFADYVRHREARLGQVVGALESGATETTDVVDAVYGQDLDPALRPAAKAAVLAYLEYLSAQGRARRHERDR